MLRNFALGGLALVGGATTGIAISSWAMPVSPPQVAPEVARVASVAQPVMRLASTSSDASEASDCSPWNVSDVAMEAALNEMIRRGWRPPSQAEAVDYRDGVIALEPDAFVPVRRPGPSAPASGSSDETTPAFPVEQILPTPEVAPIETPAVAPPPLAPTIAIEESASPSVQ